MGGWGYSALRSGSRTLTDDRFGRRVPLSGPHGLDLPHQPTPTQLEALDAVQLSGHRATAWLGGSHRHHRYGYSYQGARMTQQVRGVIARSKGAPVEVVTINVPDPSPGEAVVTISACGVCHTDMHYREGASTTSSRSYSVTRQRGDRGVGRGGRHRCGAG